MAPIVKTLPSYTKDSQHALEIVRDFNFLGQDKLLFTVDITSLHSVICHSVAQKIFLIHVLLKNLFLKHDSAQPN